jgi:hypothetical protein
MSTTVTANSSYQLPPAGIHVARCIWIIDLGTQKTEFNGKSKNLKKVRIYWELSEEKSVFDEERGEEPFFVSKEYTATIGERSNLRHDVESWQGKGLTGSEAESFELATLLGKPCMLNLIHEVSKKGRKYSKIIGVTPLPKGLHAPAAISPTLHYVIEDGFNDVFEKLPEYVQLKIQAALEMTGEPDEPDEAIAERNVRQATANALAQPHPPVGINEPTSDNFDEDEMNAELMAAANH